LSNAKDGHRPDCKQCSKKSKELYAEANPYKYRLRIMSSTILKRIKYKDREGYTHLNCYKENDVKCHLGDTVEAVMSTLDANFKGDIMKLLGEGKTPSVDRINSKGNYSLSNIRILDYKENGRLGFEEANRRKMRPVRAIFPEGSVQDFACLKDAERELGLYHTCISGLIKRGGKSRKESIRFQWIITEIKEAE
jgi:hypothetical protein